MAHIKNEKADGLLDRKISVLDKGFVRLVDYMGGDERIVQAARVSYGGGTKTVREDKALIDYLLRNKHTSPFEQVILTFHVKMPLFVARQWIRHRTARLNEISGRYSVMKDEFYIPEADKVRFQSKDNKQGRSEEIPPTHLVEKTLRLFETEQNNIYESYQGILDDGIARELARINLPLSLYTEMYWQIDLHNLFHFLKLRMDVHAQYEIRAYAEALATAAAAVAPLAYEAFEEHVLKAKSFSKSELELILASLDKNKLNQAIEKSGLRKSRKEEFLKKLEP